MSFTQRVEDFDCLHCGAIVRGDVYSNHCPRCLWSRHVDDIEPGDRAAECGGAVEPTGAFSQGTDWIIVQECRSRGHLWRNRVVDRDAVLAHFGQPVPDPPKR